MKTFNRIIYPCLTLLVWCSLSCRKGGRCEEPLNVNASAFNVDFIDQQTGRYIYSQTNPLYQKDSLKVFTESGKQILLLYSLNQIPNLNARYFVVNIGPIFDIQYDLASFDNEICRNFIVKYNHSESDTLMACFKSKSTECGSVFETLKIFHEGVLLSSSINETHAIITVHKN